MAKEWVKNSRSETRVALDARDAAEAQLGALKDKQAQMAEQVKQALRDKDSAEAGLKTTERQAEDLSKELHYCEINLALQGITNIPCLHIGSRTGSEGSKTASSYRAIEPA